MVNVQGNCSDGNLPNVNPPIPCYFGTSYFIQSYGKTKCLGVLNDIINNIFWSTSSGSSYELNASVIFGSCPKSDDVSWRFYLTNATGTYECDNIEECPINNCHNCLGDGCDQGAGCCGCTTGWSFGKYISDVFGWGLDLLETIGLIILIFIVVVIVIVVVIGIISGISKNKATSKDKKKEKEKKKKSKK